MYLVHSFTLLFVSLPNVAKIDTATYMAWKVPFKTEQSSELPQYTWERNTKDHVITSRRRNIGQRPLEAYMVPLWPFLNASMHLWAFIIFWQKNKKQHQPNLNQTKPNQTKMLSQGIEF